VRHAWYEEDQLAKINLAVDLLENERYHNIEFICSDQDRILNLRTEISRLLQPKITLQPEQGENPQQVAYFLHQEPALHSVAKSLRGGECQQKGRRGSKKNFINY
jgi:hypothetical protein